MPFLLGRLNENVLTFGPWHLISRNLHFRYTSATKEVLKRNTKTAQGKDPDFLSDLKM